MGLVTWADRAAVNDLDLLRTPVADETGGGMTSPAMAKAKGQTLRLSGQIIDHFEPGRLPQPLMPTPVTTDGKQNDSPSAWNRHSPQLGTIVHRLTDE